MPLTRPLSDPELTALLRALPRHAPSAGFADAVLARVPLAPRAPIRWRIPWQALSGLLTLELGLFAFFVIRFHTELARLPVRTLRALTDLVVAMRTTDLGDATRECLLALVPHIGSVLAWDASVLVTLSLGTVGALLSIAALGRASRAATFSR